MDSTIAIRFSELNKTYSGKPVLSNINLEIVKGEYFGLVGVNGAGKTTLIKSLLDLCSIDTGLIEIFGIKHIETESRNYINYLPEKFIPPYYLTGHDFLHYMSDLNGQAYEETTVMAVLSMLDLDNTALSKSVRNLSKGMAQKLGLAACFLNNKEVMVFDEPMGGLDPIARSALKRHLLEMKSAGKTLFFTTHQLTDVEVLCDRLAIVDKGKIQFVGTPEECKKLYETEDLEYAFVKCVSNTQVS